MQCEKFEICRNTIIDYVMNKDSFSYEELVKNIINGGGVLRVSTTQTPQNYLNYFLENNFIKYSPKEGLYKKLIVE